MVRKPNPPSHARTTHLGLSGLSPVAGRTHSNQPPLWLSLRSSRRLSVQEPASPLRVRAISIIETLCMQTSFLLEALDKLIFNSPTPVLSLL